MGRLTLRAQVKRDPALAGLLEIDAGIARVASKIFVLKTIDWPNELEHRFLKDYRAGRTRLPKVSLKAPKLDAEADALDELMRRCDQGHPIGRWLHLTAWGYRVAVGMLRGMGTPRFTLASSMLYGRPDIRHRSQTVTYLQAAEDLLRITDELIGGYRVPPAPAVIPARRFARLVRARIKDFFTGHRVRVVLDPTLSSKACAGSRCIRVREGAMFSELDIEQLVQHEAFVHTATALNGKNQRHLRSLGLGSPRTTRDQEGLATFSEIITDAVDINRLRRLALRVRMVQMAVDGADFIDVFKGFLAAGQDESEAYKSAERVFRGGDPRGGGVCFTKDCAYLPGVLRVYSFMLKAINEDRPELINALFAGRMTVADTVHLAPYFESGLFDYALYLPPWARDTRKLLAVLAFFTVATRVRLDNVTLQTFVVAEDEVYQESLQHWSAAVA